MQTIGPVPTAKGPWRKLGADLSKRSTDYANNNSDAVNAAARTVTKASGPDTIQKFASAGLGLAGWGVAAAAGTAATNALQTNGTSKGARVWNKFIRWGPLGAAYEALTDND